MQGEQNGTVASTSPEKEKKPSTTTKQNAPEGVVLFGKYELLKLLGVGASGKVHHARDVTTKQSVAVKVVSKRKLNGYTANIEREVSIMRRLRHPHTVRLFEILATKSKVYFIMEFAAAGELFALVDGEGRLTEDLSRKYFRQLVSAVRYCHSRGVFHRDLKLDNLLLDENMDLKVTDFGLSAVKDPNRPDLMLRTVCGTPAYVAPEILARKGYDGAGADVWSCGVVLFVLVSGYLPFNDYNITVLYRKIYRGHFRFPKWISRDLKNLLSRLLDTNPETRITLDEVMEDPWFSSGGYTDPCARPELEVEERVVTKNVLNAFDLITFSSGFDMSGLFTHPEYADQVERFITGKTVDYVAEKVKEVAEKGRVKVRTTEENGGGGVKIEGLDGNFVILVGFYRLIADGLVVVEVIRREISVGSSAMFWRDVLRPKLHCLSS